MSQSNENETLIRFSGAWWAYLFFRSGLLRALVNGFEDSLAVSGRLLLLLYLFYLGAQVGALLIAPTFTMPLPLAIGMFLAQIGGLEGSLPGLARQADLFRLQDRQAQAARIERVVLSARTMTICAFGEGAAYALGIDHQILQIASAVLLVARGIVITGFLIELAKIEKQAPRILSKAAYEAERAETQERAAREQEQERAAHEAELARLAQPVLPQAHIQRLVQETIAVALAQLQAEQQQMLADLSARTEQASNLQRVEMQRLLVQIQQMEERVPAMVTASFLTGQDSGHMANVTRQDTTNQTGQPVTGQPDTTPTGQPIVTGQDSVHVANVTDQLRTGQDTLDRAVAYLTGHPQATEEELADYLGFKRPASARLWRLRAQAILQAQPTGLQTGGQAAKIISLATRRSGQRTRHQPVTGQPDTTPTGQPIVTGQDSEAENLTGHMSALEPVTGQPDTPEADTDLAARITAYRTVHPDVTQVELARALGKSERTIRRKLAAMREAVLLEDATETHL